METNKKNPLGLLPMLVFLVLYLGLGITFEYIMGIEMGFYNIPIVLIILIALLVACLQNKEVKLDEKLELMGKGIGDKNIITMLLIFMMAGIFVGVVGRSSAQSVAYFVLSLIPARFAVVVLFLVSAFVSLAMGTSVGTITLLMPIGCAISQGSGFPIALCAGAVVGGAMFGDNLSFISDTTIAACNGQGCRMNDKFKENFKIALPAAIVTAVLTLIVSLNTTIGEQIEGEYDLLLVLPYILVLLAGLLGINVFVVLMIGIFSGGLIMLWTGTTTLPDMISSMGDGMNGMFETSMVAIFVAALSALMASNGGFAALIDFIQKIFKGKKGGMLGIGLLVGIMDIATANNTVAIIIANPIARTIAERRGISGRKTASLLDTFSCIFQGVIPYGAQMLVALTVCESMEMTVSGIEVIKYLFYPYMLLISSLIFIFVVKDKTD